MWTKNKLTQKLMYVNIIWVHTKNQICIKSKMINVTLNAVNFPRKFNNLSFHPLLSKKTKEHLQSMLNKHKYLFITVCYHWIDVFLLIYLEYEKLVNKILILDNADKAKIISITFMHRIITGILANSTKIPLYLRIQLRKEILLSSQKTL